MPDKTGFKRPQTETNGSRRGDFIDRARALQAEAKFNFIILQAIEVKRFFSAVSN
jgi:hypothetical protein